MLRRRDAGQRLDRRRVDGPLAAEPERGEVGRHRHAVELDRPLDVLGRDGQRAGLHGDAERHDVRRRGAAEQALRDRGGVDVAVGVGPRHGVEPLAQRDEAGVPVGAGVHDHRPGRDHLDRSDHDRAPERRRPRGASRWRRRAGRTRGSSRRRRRSRGSTRSATPRVMRTSLVTGPAFCDSPVWSRPRTSKPSSIAAVPMIWLTVMTPVPPMPDSRTVNRSASTIGRGAGSDDGSGAVGRGAPLAACRVRVDRHRRERRAVALHAREVEVAARLVDRGLAAVRRVDRLHRQAVRLVAAVAAALADPLVDDDAEGRRGQLAAAAGPPLLGGARLVVDQHRGALHAGQHSLRLGEPAAVPHLDARREHGVASNRSGSSLVTMIRLTPSAISIVRDRAARRRRPARPARRSSRPCRCGAACR